MDCLCRGGGWQCLRKAPATTARFASSAFLQMREDVWGKHAFPSYVWFACFLVVRSCLAWFNTLWQNHSKDLGPLVSFFLWQNFLHWHYIFVENIFDNHNNFSYLVLECCLQLLCLLMIIYFPHHQFDITKGWWVYICVL